MLGSSLVHLALQVRCIPPSAPVPSKLILSHSAMSAVTNERVSLENDSNH